jgi:hypothetical protein
MLHGSEAHGQSRDERDDLVREFEVDKLDPPPASPVDPSNAVLSAIYPELRWYGRVIANAEGRKTLLCCVLQYFLFPGFGVLLFVAKPQSEAKTAGLEAPNALHYLQCIAGGFVYWMLPLILEDLVRTLRPDQPQNQPDAAPTGGVDEAHVHRARSYSAALSVNKLKYHLSPDLRRRPVLALMGVGQVRISEDSHRRLHQWRCLMPVFATALSAVGTVYILGPFVRPGSFPELLDKVEGVFQGLCYFTAGWIIFDGWFLSMIVASHVSCDHVIEVLQAVVATKSLATPQDKDRWNEQVATPCVALIKQISLLSYGWGVSMLAAITLALLMALAYFARALNLPHEAARDALNGLEPGTSRLIDLALTTMWVLIPLPIMLPLAQTSSFCKKLMASLNTVRLEHGRDGHHEVEWLESGLGGLNDGGGLGFTIREKVIDVAALTHMASKTAGLMSTLIPLVLALQPIWVTSTQLQLCDLSPGLLAYVEGCVAACPAGVAVNESLVVGNCTAVPAPCVECIAPALGSARSYYV